MALAVCQFLGWLSWNPLLSSIVGGGLFALIGALIGGKYVLRSLAKERKRECQAAGRAFSAELEQNVWACVALAAAGRSQPLHYLEWHPTLSRAVFDGKLTQLSELLRPPQF